MKITEEQARYLAQACTTMAVSSAAAEEVIVAVTKTLKCAKGFDVPEFEDDGPEIPGTPLTCSLKCYCLRCRLIMVAYSLKQARDEAQVSVVPKVQG